MTELAVPRQAIASAARALAHAGRWLDASALLDAADTELDFDARAALIKEFVADVRRDSVMLPLFQFPRSAAWRTDRLGGDIDRDLLEEPPFRNWGEWEDLDGDRELVIGAEAWPECLNPVTSCANSLWYPRTVEAALLPAVWTPTADQRFEITPLVVAEPTVAVLS
jgi:hypothetical protein